MTTTREKIIEAAREALGTPFHHQARLPGVGIDCVGLLVHVAKRLEVAHTDVGAYPINPRGLWLEEILSLSLTKIHPDEAGPGDVLCFWISRPGRPQHVAVLTDGGYMVHTYADVGKVVEHVFAGKWPERVSSAWRFPGVD